MFYIVRLLLCSVTAEISHIVVKSNAGSVINIDKLLVLVEVRLEKYNILRKYHQNQDAIAKAWQLISQTLIRYITGTSLVLTCFTTRLFTSFG